MPFNTFTVASAVTPSVIETYFSHYLNRGPLKQKPTAHISYHEGLRLVRQFLEYSSKHTVEDIQGFTAQWVPVPTWVRTSDVEISDAYLSRAAELLRGQLGAKGIEKVGGGTWWTWRRQGTGLHAEWIEMRKDYNERKREGKECDRVILYVHGGAYYFGSVDEHRYQMQRHARKLKARVLAPRYRLAPQFPFPCGLYDCLATYLFLLEQFDPTQILLAGDSAGGGMVLSMLVTLRDGGIPLPAGTILLSPWVDLTHSFPSVAGGGEGDYIPSDGFIHRPSMGWPPVPPQKPEKTPTVEHPDDVVELPATAGLDIDETDANAEKVATEKAARAKAERSRNQVPGFGPKLEIELDGKVIELTEQIQLYAKNDLLAHPLVSPVQQPSLGGLPPMLIQVGGAELLRDEQIYLAHKAANPTAFPPSDLILDEYDPERKTLNKYQPTNVQLQVWEDLCHVPHTLSFTRPAKYMYRSVAQFGAWALAHAQQKGIEIPDDDAISIISGDESDNGEVPISEARIPRQNTGSIGIEGVTSTQVKLDRIGAVGKAGDELPPFKDHMIRQRVNRHGDIFPLPVQAEIASLALDPASIGAIKAGPVRKWLAKKEANNNKFAKIYKKVEKKREREAAQGYDVIEGENPPPSALINRRINGIAPAAKKKGKSWGLAMWSGWGSSHDETTIAREEKVLAEAEKEDANEESEQNGNSETTPNLAVPQEEKTGRNPSPSSGLSPIAAGRDRAGSRPKSPYRKVTDAGQADAGKIAVLPLTSSTADQALPTINSTSNAAMSRKSSFVTDDASISTRPTSAHLPIPISTLESTPEAVAHAVLNPEFDAVKVAGSENTYLTPENSRPHNGVVAYPFKLRNARGPDGQHISPNPSTMTLDSLADRSASVSGLHTPTSNGPLMSELAASPIYVFELSAAHEMRSPINGADSAQPTLASTSSTPTTSSHGGSIRLRDSRLGKIGADGMPTAAFDSTSPTSPTGATTSSANLKATRLTTTLLRPNPSSHEDDLISPIDTPATPTFISPINMAPTSLPFKLRNPPKDSRATEAASAIGPAPSSPLPPTPETFSSPAQAAPFKVRGLVPNGTTNGATILPALASPAHSFTASPSLDPSPAELAAVESAHSVYNMNGTNGLLRTPTTPNIPAGRVMLSKSANNSSLTVSAALDAGDGNGEEVDDDAFDFPPPPPPKDGVGEHDEEGGEIEGEKEERPGLETFYTAREDNDLRA